MEIGERDGSVTFALGRLLAERLNVPMAAVRIVAGETRRTN